MKTSNSTGTYLSLKLFNCESELVDWEFNQKITLSAGELNLICFNIEKINQMIDTLVGLIDSLLKPDSTEESKHSGKQLGKLLTQRALKNQKLQSQSTKIATKLMLHYCLL